MYQSNAHMCVLMYVCDDKSHKNIETRVYKFGNDLLEEYKYGLRKCSVFFHNADIGEQEWYLLYGAILLHGIYYYVMILYQNIIAKARGQSLIA